MKDKISDTIILHLSELESFVHHRIGDRELAQDVLQDSLAKAINKSDDLRDSNKILPWLYAIMRNTIINSYRSQTRHQNKIDTIIREFEQENSSLTNEICKCFYQLLPALNTDYARLISEVDLKERSRADVATEMQMSVENLNVKLHRARKSLKEKMELCCQVCAKHGCLNCTCPD